VTPFCVPMPFSRMWIARSGYRGGTDGAPPGVRVGRSAASRPAIVFRLRMRRHGAVSPEERSSALEYLRLEDGDEDLLERHAGRVPGRILTRRAALPMGNDGAEQSHSRSEVLGEIKKMQFEILVP